MYSSFLYRFTVFVAYPWYIFARILPNFKSLLSKNSRYAHVKETELCRGCHTPAAVNAIWNWYNNLKWELLVSKQKALNFNTTNIFCMKISFIENSSIFLFLGKPRSEFRVTRVLIKSVITSCSGFAIREFPSDLS